MLGTFWAHVDPMLSLCWPMLGLCWPMFACWPHVGLCWPYVEPSWRLGICWLSWAYVEDMLGNVSRLEGLYPQNVD